MTTVTMKNPRLYILLSTYNGEPFLRAQVESLIAQSYRNWELYVRDDGSHDGTLALLNELATEDKRIRVTAGDNLGVVKSFMQLLRDAPDDPEGLYSFCDQDDVWLPDKLSRAVALVSAAPEPHKTLYCSGVNYVATDLRPISTSRPPRFLDFGNAVIENVVIGCTSVIGHSIRKRMLAAAPEAMLMHDWWAYLTATAFGTVIFDEQPSILYRQHGSNVSMWESSIFSRIKNRLIEFLERWQTTGAGFRSIDQAARFAETYKHELPALHRRLVAIALKLRSEDSAFFDRLRFSAANHVHRNRRLDNWVAKVLVIARKH